MARRDTTIEAPPGHGPHWLDKYIAEHAAHYGLSVPAHCALMSGAAEFAELIEFEGEPEPK